MKKLWKWLCMLIGALVLACIALIVAVTFLIHPNDFKPLLISKFQSFTGFDAKIPGSISWSFFPHLGMAVEDMEVTKPSEFTAHMKNLVIRVKMKPLFHRQLEFSKARMSELQFNQLQASDIKAKISYKNQVLHFSPLTASFYQGDLQSDVRVSFAEATPHFHVTSDLKKVDMHTLIQALSGGHHSKLVFEGKGNVSADLDAEGKTMNALLRHLNGKGRLSIDNGVMKGIDIGYYVDTAVALITRQDLPKRSPVSQTEFGQLTGTADIKDGVIYNNDLLLESALYTVKGIGTINVVDKSLDYHLEVTLKIKPGDNQYLALAGKAIPIRVSGELTDPSVRLDTFALMGSVGKEKLQQMGEEIQKALPEKANKFLQSLFH